MKGRRPAAEDEDGMNTEKLGTSVLVVALLAVGGFAWWLQMRAELTVDAAALSTLPARIGGWNSVEVPLESVVEAELRADFNIQRSYRDATGDPVWLYLGYYGTARGGRPEHTPRGCYVGAGWGIESSRVLTVTPGSELRVNEYLVEREGRRRLVHFWFRSHRRTGILGGFDQNVDRLLGRLLDGRADGALVRLSTPLSDGDEVGARSRLLSFAAEIDPMIGERWPSEGPAAEAG